MKTKILNLMLAFAGVAALAFAAGAPEEASTAEQVEEGVPQYGGTLTLMHRASNADPGSPDIADGNTISLWWQSVVQEHPIVGDFETYGPRGTGEFSFQLRNFIPPKYLGGLWVENWEIDAEKITWHIRPGVHYAGTNSVRKVMESREVVADDVVADLIYFRNSPGGKKFREKSADIIATDRYTVEIYFDPAKGYDAGMHYSITTEDRAILQPPEIEGSKLWEDQVGTGPWVFKEYVVGSHMAFDRNDNYWDTTTVDGVEYKLPFIDEVVLPVIPDQSTRTAALRTGKIDFDHLVAGTQWETLDATAAGILSSKQSSGYGLKMFLKADESPFDDVRVRRALMIGTDLGASAELFGPGYNLPPHWFPVQPGAGGFIEYEDLPEDIQVLYEYDPALARSMLEEALGPPDADGYFLRNIEIGVTTIAARKDQAAMIADMWDKIGVEVKIRARPQDEHGAAGHERSYSHSIIFHGGVANPLEHLPRYQTGNYWNTGVWSNQEYDELVDQIDGLMDDADRAQLFEQASLILLREAVLIPHNALPEGHYWWPWVKNYYGERNVADMEIPHIVSRAWIDQELKKEMGF